MSGDFSYPPPPPPPPKVGSTWNQGAPSYTSQDRGRGRGRGRGNLESRGRGNFRGRGNQPHPNQPHHNGHGSGSQGSGQDFYSNRTQQPAYQQNTRIHLQGHHGLPTLPPGSYVNPAFPRNQQPGAADGTHRNLNVYKEPELQRFDQTQGGQPGFLPRTAAGHKRKLDALRGPQQPPREKQAGPQTAPAVPIFGASLLSPTATLHPQKPLELQKSHATPGSKPVTKALGLTPAALDLQYSSSEEEQEDQAVDEEAQYAELGNKLTFEHNGVIMSLASEADLATWKQDRRQNWPTRERMTVKERERYHTGDERRRLLDEAATALRRLKPVPARTTRPAKPDASTILPPENVGNVTESGEAPPGEIGAPNSSSKVAGNTYRSPDGRTTGELERSNDVSGQPNDLKLSANNDIVKAAHHDHERLADESVRPDNDEMGPEVDNEEDDNDAAVQQVSDDDDSIVTSDSSSIVSSDSPDESDTDSDGPPEESSSKPAATTTSRMETPLCRYYVASGRCRDGETCRFRHELPARGSGYVEPAQKPRREPRAAAPPPPLSPTIQRKTIHERLVEQEQEQNDRLALKVIKYLGKSGFFKMQADGKTNEAIG